MNRKLINFLLGAIVTALLFSSCDTFLQGSNLKNQLDEVIKDANAERVNITISALNSL